jgi:hypothetical protein
VKQPGRLKRNQHVGPVQFGITPWLAPKEVVRQKLCEPRKGMIGDAGYMASGTSPVKKEGLDQVPASSASRSLAANSTSRICICPMSTSP